MKLAIIGHDAAKFDFATEMVAKATIAGLLFSHGGGLENPNGLILVSGHCHLGGVDIWAEEAAVKAEIPKIIHAPVTLSWSSGFRPRNLAIANDADEIHVIVVAELPASNTSRTRGCYHCRTPLHIRSGACWTAKQAMKLGKPAFWHIIR